MGAGGPFTLKGAAVFRLTAVFLILVALLVTRDMWLPDASGSRQGFDQGQRPDQNAYVGTTPSWIKDTPSLEPLEQARSLSVRPTATSAIAQLTPTAVSCRDAPGADKVMVMLKTGASELYQKLPTHFVTTFTCVPHFMIFSDLAQEFAGHQIHDAIGLVGEYFRDNHADFKLYRKLDQYYREGQDLSKLKGDSGWNLDKWKFLPMLFQTFETAPAEIEWFIMIEADTSVSWVNLLLWLRTMDPAKPYYLGSQNVIGDTMFAHGGSGIVFSRGAADRLVAKRKSVGKEVYDRKWEQITSRSCCGDEIVARAFLEIDVELTPAWPRIQGETVTTIDWTDKHWCSPAITWHHVTPIEVDSLFQYQTAWTEQHGWNRPYLFSDVFDRFVARHLTVNRTNWNNICQDYRFVSEALASAEDKEFYELEDYEQEAVSSTDACAAACLRKPEHECVQWMWTPGRCYLGKDIRMGKSDEQHDEHWTSGWIPERLATFRARLEGCEIIWAD